MSLGKIVEFMRKNNIETRKEPDPSELERPQSEAAGEAEGSRLLESKRGMTEDSDL